MIDRGPDDRQAEGDVHGVIEGQGLERDVPLIVIHADECVSGLPGSGQEGGVGGNRTADLDTPVAGGIQLRRDDGFLFPVSEETVLSGVGVEAEGDQPGLTALQAGQGGVSQFNDLPQTFPGEQPGNVRVSTVASDKGGGDLLGVLHHAGALGVSQGGEDLSVSRVGNAGGPQGFLVDRGRDDGSDLAFESGLDSLGEVVAGGPAAAGVDFARADCFRIGKGLQMANAFGRGHGETGCPGNAL